MIPDHRHVPSSPGMWKEPDTGPDGLVSSFLVLHWPSPTAATCVMSARSATRPGLKNEVERVSNGWITWWVLDLSARILGNNTCQISDIQVPVMFLSTDFEKHSTTILPRSDCDIPHSILTLPPLFFFWWSNLFYCLNLLRVSLSCLPLHGFAVKSVWCAVPRELGLTLSFLSTLWLKGSPCW